MKFTITIDENLSENTLLKVFYEGQNELDLETLNIINSFIETHKKNKVELIFTAVKLIYILYDKTLIDGEILALKLYESLIVFNHQVKVDEASLEPERKWRIIKES
jgi:hypothetical protein